ncbi:hypothetical protein DPEC_G00285130 [Dallia pectoralis]|uniref:Uncharacterized protein n=1 Tax=Dallia pectoralis TaxID=75939 RepID=A0ACC2FJI5_DALPE|nr:hypothetical protein DPEC_G00285130 [Dallia pectoralis]
MEAVVAPEKKRITFEREKSQLRDPPFNLQHLRVFDRQLSNAGNYRFTLSTERTVQREARISLLGLAQVFTPTSAGKRRK